MNPIHRLVSELRRRKVFRVAGVYLVAGWAVLQVGDVVVEPLRLPDWTMPLLIAIVALGLPITVVLAWAFDLTADGFQRATPEPAAAGASASYAAPSSPGSPQAAAYVGLGMLVALVGFGSFAYLGGPAERTDAITSVAVLPFENRGGDEYFSDGITEELLGALAQIEGLRVPARTSSFQFKERNPDIREVGRKLNVQAVVEGSVQRAGQSVRIRAQLVDAETGHVMWSDDYDREPADIFALQDEIGREIVRELRLKLAPGDVASADTKAPTTIEAHDLFLLGRYHFHRRGAALRTAERHFLSAIEADPDYARAHAGLALTYAVLPLFDTTFTVEAAIREGKRAALRALDLNPSLADAHSALGQIAQNYEWDWDAAARHYDQAVRLAPNDAVARQWRAEVGVVHGRMQAVEEMERAVALDPLSPIANSVAALTHLFVSRDYPRSVHFWQRAAEIDPMFPLVRENSAFTFIAMGQWDEARRRLLWLAETPADTQAVRDWIAAASTLHAGRSVDDDARRRAVDAARVFGPRMTGDVGVVKLLGPIDPELALDHLVTMIDDPRYSQPLTWLTLFWFFDQLHDDPRYVRVRRAVKLG